MAKMKNPEIQNKPFSNIFGSGLKIKPEYPGVVNFVPEPIFEISKDILTTDTANPQFEIKELVLASSKGGE